ncbi:hypothetical protein BJY00DRAFT_217262 [Aspergillus carlsbadensis]|nr:hypothetical protein BJY00DRAFT_217262 [Aspergillus carlsbadensis]
MQAFASHLQQLPVACKHALPLSLFLPFMNFPFHAQAQWLGPLAYSLCPRSPSGHRARTKQGCGLAGMRFTSLLPSGSMKVVSVWIFNMWDSGGRGGRKFERGEGGLAFQGFSLRPVFLLAAICCLWCL